MRAIYRARQWERHNVTSYSRLFFDSMHDTNKPSTVYQEYVSEIWIPDEGSTTIYTMVMTRPGDNGLRFPAPPPPSDADKVFSTRDDEVGLVRPRAYKQASTLEYNVRTDWIGNPFKVLPNGREFPVRWSARLEPEPLPIFVRVGPESQQDFPAVLQDRA